MRRLFRSLCIFISLTLNFTAQAGLPTGEWKTHMSYVEGQSLAVSENKIYVLASGSLFSYGLQDNALETYSTVTGLNDVYISEIAYSEQDETLVICYENGNIDLMSSQGISNIPYLKLKAVYGSKQINAIDIYDGKAYISTSIGVLNLNIAKAEISETYTLSNGETNNVNGVAIFDGEIYAASDNGLYKASMQSLNLQNFAEWSLASDLSTASSQVLDITTFKDHLIVAQYLEGESYQYQVYRLGNDNSWSRLAQLGNFIKFGQSEDLLTMSCYSEIAVFNQYFTLQSSIKNYNFLTLEFTGQNTPKAYAAIPLSDGSFGIADEEQGLVIYAAGSESQSIYPDGPATNTIWDIDITENILRTVHGAVEADYDITRTPGAISTLEDDTWHFIDTNRGVPAHPWGSDMLAVATDPNDLNRYYVNSFHKGLIEFYNDSYVTRYTTSNSTLVDVATDPGAIRNLGVCFDDDNNLWLTNSNVDEKIHMRNEEGEWFSFTPSNTDDAKIVEDITFTDGGLLWIVTPYWGKGIIVYDHKGTYDDSSDDESKYFSVYGSNSDGTTELVSDQVYEIEKDNDGNLWVGTDNGIAIYYSPDDVFESSGTPIASRVNIPRNDGTGYGDYLLANESVFAIAVDGGNRKWLATESSGVYLVSSDGLDEIAHFTKENSPLLSNTVRTVEINQESGEVYFATEAGLISYQADASSGNSDYSDLKVYPNPVREDFFGDVTITGLVEETTVKITDITGNLVNQTSSNGGTATWNCKNFRGERVGTGVYLIFCSDPDGTQSAMTKIMVVN